MNALLHIFFIIKLIGPVILILWGYLKWKNIPSDSPAPQWKILPTVINSAILYALAYNVIYFIQELFLALGKKWIGLKAYLYHNNHNWVGEDPRDDLMQGLGALAIFVLGCLLLFLFFRIRHSTRWTSLFVLWLAHHGLMQSLPQLSSVTIDRRSDMGQAITYLDLGLTTEYILSYVSIMAIIGLAYGFSKWFMQFAPANYRLDHGFARMRSIFYLVLLPAIVGTLILFPYRIMPIDRYQMTVILLIIGVPFTFAFSWMLKGVEPIGNEINNRIVWTPVILSILVLIFFQLVLAPGVVFE